jgi:Tol biopolymer transport system component
MKMKLILMLSLPLGIAGLLAGCGHSNGKPISAVAAGHPTSQPATAPAVPDPREAQYLTDVTQLTSGFKAAGEGYFSKDMKWIIFQATPEGETQYQMYVAPLEMGDGASPKIGAPIRISPPNSRNTCGYFSPDGKTVIFGSTAGKEKADEPSAGYQRQGNNYRWAFPDGMEIYASAFGQATLVEAALKHRVEPTTHKNLTWPPPDRAPELLSVDLAKPQNRLTNNDAYDAEGSFSPDGKWICFTSRRSGDTEIWVMQADGSNAVQITKNPGYDGGPFFAPDGKRLIYRSDRKANDLLQVFTCELAFDEAGNISGMKSEKQLTDDANVNWGPFFHPDNTHIIYATSQHGHHNYELYLMRDDGSHQQRITWCAGFDALPVFSSDGKYVMWSSKRTKDGTTQLFIAKFHMPKDG